MKYRLSQFLVLAVTATLTFAIVASAEPRLNWVTVVNNNDLMPPLAVRNFNSYNQPSVNVNGLVVIRARSKGGPPLGQPTHGIYMRDMSAVDSDIISILDNTTQVPHPNDLETRFVETPSFPRIDIDSDTIVTRANHGPVRKYQLDDGTEIRAGTAGIYANPFGVLVTGAAKLGDTPGFDFYRVPEFNGIRFEVFPGAPSVTDGNTIAFKGNYTVGDLEKTGVYYRDLEPVAAGGTSPAVLIANNTDTLIPGTQTLFGSVAPPNAANRKVVFAGFDDENAPTLGGIYLAPLQFQPPLTTLVSIGEQVPGESGESTFSLLGEGIAFDGQHAAFWGAWGNETRTLRLYCPEEGNRDRIAYCNQALVCADSGETFGDPNSVCDDTSDPNFGTRCYTDKEVPLHQGLFVHDTRTRKNLAIVKTKSDFDDYLFWTYSGKTPCVGAGHDPGGAVDDGEQAHWRSSAFVAVSARTGATFNIAFKARTGDLIEGSYVDPVDGIYASKGPGQSRVVTVLDTTTNGLTLDPEAPAGSRISELGIEREGLRGNWLAINASMGIEGDEEEDGMAGIYITRLR